MPVWHETPHQDTDSATHTPLDLLLATLAQVIDPRKPRGVRYSLVCLLAFAVIGVLAGATNYRQLGDQAKDLPAPLPRLLGAPIRPTGHCLAPEESTLRRVLGQINSDELDHIIGNWLLSCAEAGPHSDNQDEDDSGDRNWYLHLDGKVLRGSYNDQGQLKLFSAFESTSGVVAAQVQIPQDSEENTRDVQAVLGQIDTDLAGAVITADAAHTHAPTARHIVADHKADYVFTVKRNSEKLYTALCALFYPLTATTAHYEHTEAAHGRISTWQGWAAPAPDTTDFPYLERVACLCRRVYDSAANPISKEYAFVITSAPGVSARWMAERAREHWGVENKEHYVRDVVWAEDAQQAYTGSGPRVMATLRNTAMSLIRLAGIDKIKATLEEINRDRTRILPLLTLATQS